MYIKTIHEFNPIAVRMAKTLWSFGRSDCNRVYFKEHLLKAKTQISDDAQYDKSLLCLRQECEF